MHTPLKLCLGIAGVGILMMSFGFISYGADSAKITDYGYIRKYCTPSPSGAIACRGKYVASFNLMAPKLQTLIGQIKDNPKYLSSSLFSLQQMYFKPTTPPSQKFMLECIYKSITEKRKITADMTAISLSPSPMENNQKK